MAIFAIIQQPGLGSEKLAPAIMEKFPTANYPLGNGAWLISGPQTAIEASQLLGLIPEADAGSALILEVASYYGRANPAIWSWIKNNWEGTPLG